MADQEPGGIDQQHHFLMLSILHRIADQPIYLKGGYALQVGYGSERTSDDLDFDAPRKIRNFEKEIMEAAPDGITIKNVDILKDTDTTSRYRINYDSPFGRRTLKIEISYRTPPHEDDIVIVNGIKMLSLPTLLNQKLEAAHDGDHPRTKGRDLYDLDFIARAYQEEITLPLAERLQEFAKDPDVLAERYGPAFKEQGLEHLGDVEEIALRLSINSGNILEGLQQRGRSSR